MEHQWSKAYKPKRKLYVLRSREAEGFDNFCQENGYDWYKIFSNVYRPLANRALFYMPDKMMDLMEPYKYGELGDFDAKYLSGFQAEVYDEDKNTLLPRAKKKADKYSQKYLSSYNVEYDAVRPTVNDKKSTEKESFYSFLPVWRYVYRYQGKNYEFYVNGQTGKAVGEAPTSTGKIIAWFIAVFGSLFFTVEMLLYLLWVL